MKAIWLKAWHDLRARRAAVLVIFGTVAVVAALLTVAVAMSVNGFTFFDRLHAETELMYIAPVTVALSALAGLVPALQAGHTPVVTVLRGE